MPFLIGRKNNVSRNTSYKKEARHHNNFFKLQRRPKYMESLCLQRQKSQYLQDILSPYID